MKTYQDFISATDKLNFITDAIDEHRNSRGFRDAKVAKAYDAKRNLTIETFQRYVYDAAGKKHVDFLAANNKISSNFFSQIVTQQSQYLLGNGVFFPDEATTELVKGNPEKKTKGLFARFDFDVQKAARTALVTGAAFGFLDEDRIRVFDITEFIPLFDEESGALRAGINFYRVDVAKPVFVYLFEEDGVTKYRKNENKPLELAEAKRAYLTTYTYTEGGGILAATADNYSTIPIVPLYNLNRLSELVGRRSQIDAYDLTVSGLLNDIDETAFSYWLLSNAGGMDREDAQQFMENLKRTHVAMVDSESQVTAHQQDVPVDARKTSLEKLEDDIYRDFGALNYRSLSTSGVTATAIDAAFTPVDDKCSEFEYLVIDFVQSILSLKDIQGESFHFVRQKLENKLEEAQVEQTKAATVQIIVNTIKSLDTELDTATILQAVKEIVPALHDIDIDAVMRARDDESGSTFETM